MVSVDVPRSSSDAVMSRKDQLLRILAQLDKHCAADDYSPAAADRWRGLKRHTARMKDGLDLAWIELDGTAQDANNALRHVGYALGEGGNWGDNAMRQRGRQFVGSSAEAVSCRKRLPTEVHSRPSWDAAKPHPCGRTLCGAAIGAACHSMRRRPT